MDPDFSVAQHLTYAVRQRRRGRAAGVDTRWRGKAGADELHRGTLLDDGLDLGGNQLGHRNSAQRTENHGKLQGVADGIAHPDVGLVGGVFNVGLRGFECLPFSHQSVSGRRRGAPATTATTSNGRLPVKLPRRCRCGSRWGRGLGRGQRGTSGWPGSAESAGAERSPRVSASAEQSGGPAAWMRPACWQ